MLYPFFGASTVHAYEPGGDRFDAYVPSGRDFFTLNPPDSAAIFVLPFAWEHAGSSQHMAAARALQDLAQSQQKPLVVFFFSDSTAEVPLENSTVFRTSGHGSRRRLGEFGHPAWCEDLRARYANSTECVRPWTESPTVSFCGFAGYRRLPPRSGVSQLRQTLRRVRHGTRPLTIREKAVDALIHADSLDARVVLRDAFWGGLGGKGATPATRHEARTEFARSIIESDYVLCVRGGGNFSYRLYETLSCGRIPVFVNTDCLLPYDFLIDYRDEFVWVEADEIGYLEETIVAFHAALSPSEFERRQRRCRELWEQLLSPKGFFENFYRHFDPDLRILAS